MENENIEELNLVNHELLPHSDLQGTNLYTDIELSGSHDDRGRENQVLLETEETRLEEHPHGEAEEELSDTEDAKLRKPSGDTDNEDLSSSDSVEHLPPRPVYISKQDGEIRKEDALISGADGSVVIVTPAPEPWEQDHHIRPRDIHLLFAFSMVSIILFFPTGIVAMIYAKRTSRAFYHGLEVGNLEDARSYSKTSERLIISSVVCGLLCVVLILSVIEKAALSTADREEDTPRFLHGLH